MTKFYDLKYKCSKNKIEKYKKYLKTHECPNINVDLSSLNIFDAAEFIVLSSVYHSQKYPAGKLKYSVSSPNIKYLISNFTMNFELVTAN